VAPPFRNNVLSVLTIFRIVVLPPPGVAREDIYAQPLTIPNPVHNDTKVSYVQHYLFYVSVISIDLVLCFVPRGGQCNVFYTMLLVV
jgi:hypothetical protein